MTRQKEGLDLLKEQIEKIIIDKDKAARLFSIIKTEFYSQERFYDTEYIRKTFSIPVEELKNIELIKDKALNKKIILRDSEVIRMSLLMMIEVSEEDLIQIFGKMKILQKGRPKSREKV